MFYILRDNQIKGTTATRELAIDMIRTYQEHETERYYFGEVSYSIIEGGQQEFIPYLDKERMANYAKRRK